MKARRLLDGHCSTCTSRSVRLGFYQTRIARRSKVIGNFCISQKVYGRIVWLRRMWRLAVAVEHRVRRDTVRVAYNYLARQLSGLPVQYI